MALRIKRIRVEEGFLHGLDLEFAPGLNVLIGARGTGKSSIIELIRFALGSQSFTDQADERGTSQAKSVLGAGRVVLTLEDDGEVYDVERSADDPPANAELEGRGLVSVLGQNELEAVAAQPMGRVRLLDRFRRLSIDEMRVVNLMPRLASITADVQGTLGEILDIERRLTSLADVPDRLAEAMQEQAAVLSAVEGARSQEDDLRRLQDEGSVIAMEGEMLSEARSRVERYLDRIQSCLSGTITLDPWPAGAASEDLLAGVRSDVEEVTALVDGARTRLETSLAALSRLESEAQQRRTSVENEIRTIRVALNEAQAGAGAVTRKVDELRERQGQLDALRERRELRLAHLAELQDSRRETYSLIEKARESRSESRTAVSKEINSNLGKAVHIDVRRSARKGQYVVNLVNALRGSGVHYNKLAPGLAAEFTPLELVEIVERGGYDSIAKALDVPSDRAAAVVAHLREANLSDLVASPIDDAVDFLLLVGGEYRAADHLSIGQRCTTVLPILLSLHDRVLIVDQPEDNLDNKFVAETLVTSLRGREPGDQLILSSHNPNVPVLGEADRVVVLASDGRRGWVDHAGDLDDPETVEAVSSLLEGGAEAFARRSAFYEQRVTSGA